MCRIRFNSSIVVFMHDVFHSKARVPRVTWMHSWAKCCGGERLLPTNPIWFQTRPGPVEKCKKLFGRLSRRQWVWNSECVCMCVCGCSCHACRCSFQFNCLRLMAWVLRCHSNRRLMWIATVRVTSQSPSKSNALHVQEINGSTADILLELYDDQRKILGQNDTWAGSIDSCRLYSCALQLCRGNTTSLQPRWRFWPRPWKITEIWK